MADILVSKLGSDPVVAAYIDNRLEFLSVVHESDLGSVYLCRVDNVIKNLESAFVRFQDEQIGYIPLKHVLGSTVVNRNFSEKPILRQGDEVILQIETESIKSKKAKLTSYISVPGKYSVVTLGRKGVGASLKLDSAVRETMITAVKSQYSSLCEEFRGLSERDGFGIIIRTEAGILTEDEFNDAILSDIRDSLTELERILTEGAKRTVCSCIKKSDAGDVSAHIKKAQNFLKGRGITESDIIDSSVFYNLKGDVEKLLSNKVWLKSGGFLIIEQLESFNAIDVNTGKAIDGKKDAIVRVNFEAADEIFRQIRLRNLTGMILIDFINFKNRDETEKLCEYVKSLCRKEPVHTEYIDITGLGIVELTRNKNDKSLKEILNC